MRMKNISKKKKCKEMIQIPLLNFDHYIYLKYTYSILCAALLRYIVKSVRQSKCYIYI